MAIVHETPAHAESDVLLAQASASLDRISESVAELTAARPVPLAPAVFQLGFAAWMLALSSTVLWATGNPYLLFAVAGTMGAASGYVGARGIILARRWRAARYRGRKRA